MGQPMECHLFLFHGESLYLGLGLRVFFGNSGVCKARMFESVENEEGEDREDKKSPGQRKLYQNLRVHVVSGMCQGCLVCAFSVCLSLDFNHLCARKKSLFRHVGSNSGSATY